MKTKSIKMPSAMIGSNPVHSATSDLGNGSQPEAMKQVLGVVDKKVRNMEKKKSKLDDYQAKKSNGEKLNHDQLEALSKYQEILNNIEFARELQKSFLTLGQEIQKVVKKTARREQMQREETEHRRLKTVLELQFLLDQLGDDNVRQDLKRPDASGAALLTDADLASLDEFYKLVGPDRNCDVRLTEQYEEASQHLWELLEGKDKAVAGTSYKSLKGIVDKLLQSGYFDRPQSGHNGTCEEADEVEQLGEEDQEKQAVVADSNVNEQPSQPEATVPENHPEPVQLETTEFVNRHFIPESTFNSIDTEHVEEWSVDMQVVTSLQLQPPAQMPPEPSLAVNQIISPPTDPVVRKQVVQDLMAQMQGTYNFMQDSVLDFDGQAMDPAIVAAQPMKPVHTVDLQQIVCAPSHTESRLPPISAVTGPKEPSQVFNMSAPAPLPGGQTDALKPSPFPASYGQSFTGQSETAVDQPNIPQETLQSVVAGFQSQAQVVPTAVVREDSSPSSGYGPSSQPFYSSRGMPRGGGNARSSRGGMNGYRGSSNGFRGGYEGYRPPFSNVPSSGYGQSQFNTGARDYSSNNYQREGYQQGYKRGAAQAPRGLGRGNAQAMRS
ncbi:caprin-1-like isoform X4 [Stigmatopora argus]